MNENLPKKVCFVIDVLKNGGTEKQLIEIIRNLNPKKVKVYLVCLRDSEMFENINTSCTKLLLNIEHFKSINVINKIKQLRSFLLKEEIDIVQTFFFDANILGIISARLAGVKKIISCRRDMGFWYDKKKLNYLKFINKFVDRFLVNSEAIKENLSNIENVSKDKIDVIYNGIDLKLFDSIKKKTKAEIKKDLNIPYHHIVV
jgi:glycosyltransferase involved in cell wall biosynthesis